MGFTVLFCFVLPCCHFEPPADQLWSQAAGQPQSPSEAPVTGLSSHWKPQETCPEYCNPHPTNSAFPRRSRKGSLEPPDSEFRGLKSRGSPKPALGGGAHMRKTRWPHGRGAAAFGLVEGRFSFTTAKRLPFSPSNYSAVSHQDGC